MAIGGNALMPEGEPSTDAQRSRMSETCARVAALVRDGWRVVITHGNGPQVGAALLRSERAADGAYTLPLDVCVASTQGEMGYLLQEALGAALTAERSDTPVATVLTRVVVSPDDPAFTHPTKPIGSFYQPDEVEALTDAGWSLVEQPPHGYRRAVPSPDPHEIAELASIRTLVEAGAVVIALGGGGIPVVRRGTRLEGVEAVVDKDLSSALLATQLGVDLFLVITNVDGVYLHYGTPSALRLDAVTPAELEAHAAAGHFPAGSMGPKAEAIRRFIAAGGAHAIVTLPEHLCDAVAGREGTHVFGDGT